MAAFFGWLKKPKRNQDKGTNSETSKLSIDELASGIVSVCLGSEKTLQNDTERLKTGLLKNVVVDPDVVFGELFFLRLSIAAYCGQRCFADSVREQMVPALGARIGKILLQSTDKRVRQDPNRVIDEFFKRGNRYYPVFDAYRESSQQPRDEVNPSKLSVFV